MTENAELECVVRFFLEVLLLFGLYVCYVVCSEFFFSVLEEHKFMNSELWHSCTMNHVRLSTGSPVLYFSQGRCE